MTDRTPFAVSQAAVVDVETTGLHPESARVVQYGLVLCSLPTLAVRQVKSCYVDPTRDQTGWRWSSASPEAMAVHQLTPDFLRDAGHSPADALRVIFSNINWKETVFAGWGADFDSGFTRAEFRRQGQRPPFRHRIFDVRSLCGEVSLATAHYSPGYASGEYAGLTTWLRSMEKLELVKRLGRLGTFDQIDERLRALDRLEHNAVADALRTVKAWRIAHAFVARGVSSLYNARLLEQ